MRTLKSLREEAASLFSLSAVRVIEGFRWYIPRDAPTPSGTAGLPPGIAPATLPLLEAPHLRERVVVHLEPGRPLTSSPLLLSHPELRHPRFLAQNIGGLPGALLLLLAPPQPTRAWLDSRVPAVQALAAELPGAAPLEVPAAEAWPRSPHRWRDEAEVAALWATLGVRHPYADLGGFGTVAAWDLGAAQARLRGLGPEIPAELHGVSCAVARLLGGTVDPARAERALLAECWRGPVVELAGLIRVARPGLWPWQGAAEVLADDPHRAALFQPVTGFPSCLDAQDPFGPGLLEELARRLARRERLRDAFHTIRNAGALTRLLHHTRLTGDALRLHAELATALDPDGAAATLATLAAEA